MFDRRLLAVEPKYKVCDGTSFRHKRRKHYYSITQCRVHLCSSIRVRLHRCHRRPHAYRCDLCQREVADGGDSGPKATATLRRFRVGDVRKLEKKRPR